LLIWFVWVIHQINIVIYILKNNPNCYILNNFSTADIFILDINYIKNIIMTQQQVSLDFKETLHIPTYYHIDDSSIIKTASVQQQYTTDIRKIQNAHLYIVDALKALTDTVSQTNKLVVSINEKLTQYEIGDPNDSSEQTPPDDIVNAEPNLTDSNVVLDHEPDVDPYLEDVEDVDDVEDVEDKNNVVLDSEPVVEPDTESDTDNVTTETSNPVTVMSSLMGEIPPTPDVEHTNSEDAIVEPEPESESIINTESAEASEADTEVVESDDDDESEAAESESEAAESESEAAESEAEAEPEPVVEKIIKPKRKYTRRK
jgi:hypothetical protein